MDSITKQLKSIIKEAILAEMFIKNFENIVSENMVDHKSSTCKKKMYEGNV